MTNMQTKSISELQRANDLELLLKAPPYQAAFLISWPYFRLYLLNAFWAIPLLFIRDDWTWIQICKISLGCFGVGFCFGLLASTLYHVSKAVNRLAVQCASVLAAPAAVIPILLAIDDGPAIMANYWVALAVLIWVSIVVMYIVVSIVVSLLTFQRAS